MYTLFELVAHPLAQCEPPNTTENEGAKFDGTADVTVVYVVPDSFPIRSLPLKQYITSAIFVKLILLLLAINDDVSIEVVVPDAVIV